MLVYTLGRLLFWSHTHTHHLHKHGRKEGKKAMENFDDLPCGAAMAK